MNFEHETMKVKICKACKGLGYIDGIKCPECGGSGRLVHEKDEKDYLMSSIESNTISFDPSTMKIKICKTCKGLGYFMDSNGNRTECMDCKGYGRIVNYNVNTEHQMAEFNLEEE